MLEWPVLNYSSILAMTVLKVYLPFDGMMLCKSLFYCYFISVLVIFESAASGYLGGGGLGTPHTREEYQFD